MLDVLFDPNNYPFWILIIAIIAGAIAIISRPFSTYVKFVYPNAKYEAIGNPYVSEKEISKLADSKNLDDFADALNSNKNYKIESKKSSEIQDQLDNNFIKTIEMMKKDSSKKMIDFYDAYLEKQDFYLIKNLLKDKLNDKEFDENIFDRAVLVKTKNLLKNISSAEKNKISEVLKDNNFPKNLTDTLSEENVDLIKFDNEFDKFIVEKLKDVRVPYKCKDGKNKFINYLVDTINIKNVLRAKQIGYDEKTSKKLFIGEGQEIASWKYNELAESDSVSQIINSLQGTSYYDSLKNVIEDYNKENSVQVLENALDGNFLKLMKDISTENYVTIGPTIRFIVSKEFEVKNLKIIAKGLSENIPSDTIKKLLIMEANL